jgi:hypothetical protein
MTSKRDKLKQKLADTHLNAEKEAAGANLSDSAPKRPVAVSILDPTTVYDPEPALNSTISKMLNSDHYKSFLKRNLQEWGLQVNDVREPPILVPNVDNPNSTTVQQWLKSAKDTKGGQGFPWIQYQLQKSKSRDELLSQNRLAVRLFSVRMKKLEDELEELRPLKPLLKLDDREPTESNTCKDLVRQLMAEFNQKHHILNKKLDALTEDNVKLKEDNVKLMEDNVKLNTKLDIVTKDNVKLNTKLDIVTKDNVKLTKQLDIVTKDNVKLNEQVHGLYGQIADLKLGVKHVQDLEKKLADKNLRNLLESFYAKVSQTSALPRNAGESMAQWSERLLNVDNDGLRVLVERARDEYRKLSNSIHSSEAEELEKAVSQKTDVFYQQVLDFIKKE